MSGKSSKKSSLVCLYNKHDKWVLVDMEFHFWCSTLYFNSISARTHVLTSICPYLQSIKNILLHGCASEGLETAEFMNLIG